MAIFGLPGGMEWVIILAIVLLLFGPRNLPRLGKSIGKTIRGVREGVEGKIDEDDDEEELPAAKGKSGAKVAAKADEEELEEE